MNNTNDKLPQWMAERAEKITRAAESPNGGLYAAIIEAMQEAGREVAFYFAGQSAPTPTAAEAQGVPSEFAAFLREGARVIGALIVKSDCHVDRNQEFYDAAQWNAKALRYATPPQPANPASAPVQRHPVTKQPWGTAQGAEPVAWMWQHPETGNIGFVEHASPEDLAHWERVNRPRKIIKPLGDLTPQDHTAPTPQEQAEPSPIEWLKKAMDMAKLPDEFRAPMIGYFCNVVVNAALDHKADSTEGGKHD